MAPVPAASGVPSAPFGVAALALCGGAWAGPLLRVAPLEAAGACLALALLACLGLHRARPAVVSASLLAGILVLGLGVARPEPHPPLQQEAHVLGRVTASTGRAARVRTAQGDVVLEFEDAAPERGTRLAAWARQARPEPVLPGAFSHTRRDRLAGRPRLRVRQWVPLGSIAARSPSPRFASLAHGGLLVALASGDRGGIDPSTTALLTRTGTRHLLAISGLHLGLVASLVLGLSGVVLGPLRLVGHGSVSAALAACAAVGAAGWYASSVGWPVSTQRAIVMLSVAAVGRALHRDSSSRNLLGLAAIVVVLGDPSQVRAPGFLLSFGAVWGMLTVTPWCLRWLPPDLPRPVTWLVGGAAASLGAQIGTLPVTAWLFQELAPLGVVANLVAGPLLGLVAVPGSLLGLHLPDSPLGDLLSGVCLRVADGAVSVTVAVLHGIDVPPWRPAVGPLGAAGLAAVLATRRRPWVGALVLLVVLGVRLRFPSRELVVTFLSVGQGDAALVEFPDGRRWLIDGGPRPRAVLSWLRRRGIRRLDAVVLSHPHPDHGAGLQAVLEELPVDELWVSRPPEREEQSFWTLWKTAFDNGVAIRGPSDPAGAGIEVLHPLPDFRAPRRTRINEESLVLRVVHGETSFLFTGDIEGSAEAVLALDLPHTDVVKVPHHGSRSSSSRVFAEACRPVLVVVSCGPNSRFGHPHAEALAAWRDASVVRTDRDGTVEVRSDGAELTLRSWTPDRGWKGLPRQAWRPRSPGG